MTVQVNTKLDSPASKALINTLRSGDKAAAQGLQVFVGGSQADSLDFNNYLLCIPTCHPVHHDCDVYPPIAYVPLGVVAAQSHFDERAVGKRHLWRAGLHFPVGQFQQHTELHVQWHN